MTNPKLIEVSVPVDKASQSLPNFNPATGRLQIPALWVGKNTALHCPVSVKNGGTKATRGTYALTHLESGLSFGTLNTNQQQAKKIARAWDDRCGSIDPKNARTWEHREAWGQVLSSFNEAWKRTHIATTTKVREQWGTTKSNVGSQDLAMLLAAKAGLAIDQAGRSKKIQWRGKFWTAPSEAELDYWTFDSVCETPDGRTVEPDAPDSWLRILGLV